LLLGLFSSMKPFAQIAGIISAFAAPVWVCGVLARRALPDMDSCRVDSQAASRRRHPSDLFMPREIPVNKKHDFNAALNGYRGFCALLVFVFHLGSAGVVSLPSGTLLKDAAANLWISLDMASKCSHDQRLRNPRKPAAPRNAQRLPPGQIHPHYSAWMPALAAVTLVCIALNMKMFTDASFLEGLGIFAGNLFCCRRCCRCRWFIKDHGACRTSGYSTFQP